MRLRTVSFAFVFRQYTKKLNVLEATCKIVVTVTKLLNGALKHKNNKILCYVKRANQKYVSFVM